MRLIVASLLALTICFSPVYTNATAKNDYMQGLKARAAEGDPEALYTLSLYICMQMQHDESRETEIECFEAILRAAKRGHAKAQSEIGQAYIFSNFGVKVDYPLALKWLNKSVVQGDPNGKFYLGFMYWFGYSVVKDKTKALGLIKEAVAAGNDMAIKFMKDYKNGKLE